MAEQKSEPEQSVSNESSSTEQPSSTSITLQDASDWWNSWFEKAKSKSHEVLSFVKNDLGEVASVVKNEASSVVHSTTSVIKDSLKLEEEDSTANSVKRSISSFLGSVSSALNPLPEDDDQEALVVSNETVLPLTRLQTKLHSLITNKETFTTEIEEDLQSQYKTWFEISEDLLSTDKLTKLLMASPELHSQYESLVPEEVSHVTFWKRYLFRKAFVEDEECRRQALEKRDEKITEELEWEKQDFAPNVDISEEDQIRLLTEYEKEKNKTTTATAAATTTTSTGETVSSQVSSTDTDDWEKDFDLDETNNE